MLSRKRVRTLPADDDSCGWSSPLPPPPPATPLDGDRRVDCAVIGAGYTGLAIARRLAELRPEWRVTILEAQRVADGTSGRASGFVVDLTDVAVRMDPESRARYVNLARSGIEELRRLVEEHGIDCAWDETGWIRGAAGAAGERALNPLPAIYDELGMEYRHLDAERMAAITGTRFYRRGIHLLGYPLVQTAALVRGLSRVLPESVELCEESPVLEIERGAPLRLAVRGKGGRRHTVTADRVFLATNGYTPALGFLSRRVFPLYTFGSMTRVLEEQDRELLGGEREWGILAMDPMGSSVRRTRDQRILIRNTAHYAKDLRIGAGLKARMRENHRQAFLARFPQLAHVEFEYTWSGLMGTSHNNQIHFGQLGRGLFATAGFTGAGIAMGTTAGRLLADLAAGVSSEPLSHIRRLPNPTWMPPEPFRSIGGRWLTARMNAKAEEATL
jgi:glycine/D-amino acid oxidase-like deaminating enzyme